MANDSNEAAATEFRLTFWPDSEWPIVCGGTIDEQDAEKLAAAIVGGKLEGALLESREVGPWRTIAEAKR